VKKQSRGKFRINSTKHADFRLKWRILKKNTKITLSGEVLNFPEKIRPLSEFNASTYKG
jgi:hypothetical protein